MAAAKTKRTPLVTVIEQLRADNSESALMHDARDVKRDTMLVDINAELTSIKDSILSTRDVLLDRNQQDEMKTSNTSLSKISDNIGLLDGVIEWLQTLAFKIDASNSLLYSIEFTSGKQVDLMGETFGLQGTAEKEKDVRETDKDTQGVDSLVTETSKGTQEIEVVKDETSKGTNWLEKIFVLQEDEIMRQKERDREADRKGRLEAGGDKGEGSGGDGAGKGGKFGKMLKGLFTIFTGLFKGIGKFALLLLKPLVWLARLPLMLASVTALWVGLAAVVAFFAAVTVASMTMSQEDFDKLKMNIANGVAGAISKVVEGAMSVWNSFVPESWKIDEESKKAFTEGTFTAVSETIVAVIEFVEGIGRTNLLMTKASGTLEININIDREKAKEIKTMIDNAGVSSFYLGKKGLAYITDIDTREARN